tara:strand:+ start:86 stop:676 length:591 start_codon:yes stop_codon:yes gene_type:complete
MYEIFGEPVIWWVIKSIKQVNFSKKIVVATSKNKSDEKLYRYLKGKNILVFRGSLNNVAERLNNTAEHFKSKFFIRICADSPLIDGKIVDKAISLCKKNMKNFDIITNTFPKKTFPKGMSVELIKASILKDNIRKMSKDEKEHVTKFFYKNFKKFKIITFKNKNKINNNQKKFSLALDNVNDIQKIKKKLLKKFKI